MAPEMCTTHADYDEKIDVWSLGMVLFELLTLDVPYRVRFFLCRSDKVFFLFESSTLLRSAIISIASSCRAR